MQAVLPAVGVEMRLLGSWLREREEDTHLAWPPSLTRAVGAPGQLTSAFLPPDPWAVPDWTPLNSTPAARLLPAEWARPLLAQPSFPALFGLNYFFELWSHYFWTVIWSGRFSFHGFLLFSFLPLSWMGFPRSLFTVPFGWFLLPSCILIWVGGSSRSILPPSGWCLFSCSRSSSV